MAIDNTGTVAKAWGDVQLTPTTFVVNKKGEIVKRYVGEPNFAELHQLIEKLLAERPERTSSWNKAPLCGALSFWRRPASCLEQARARRRRARGLCG